MLKGEQIQMKITVIEERQENNQENENCIKKFRENVNGMENRQRRNNNRVIGGPGEIKTVE